MLRILTILWIASEVIVMLLRHSGPGSEEGRDRGSLALLWGAITASIFAGVLLHPRFAQIANREAALDAGMALMIAGIVIRGIAIATLWRYFTVNVAIREGHQLVDFGIYRFLRHPAYTGSLLTFLGFGITRANWISAAIVAAGVALAFGYRIAVEERALIDHFGDRYRAYAARTKRLIPGVY